MGTQPASAVTSWSDTLPLDAIHAAGAAGAPPASAAHYLPPSDAPDEEAHEEEGARHLPDSKAVIPSVERGHVRLSDGAVEGEWTETERVDQTLDLSRSSIAL